jgi:hypothetical protein
MTVLQPFTGVMTFSQLSFHTNVPINCLPHLPHLGRRWGIGWDLTHISCNGPTPGRDRYRQIPPPTPYLSPIMRVGDLPQWHRTINCMIFDTLPQSPLNTESLIVTCDICPTPRAIFLCIQVGQTIDSKGFPRNRE